MRNETLNLLSNINNAIIKFRGIYSGWSLEHGTIIRKVIEKLGIVLVSVFLLGSTTPMVSFANEVEDPFTRLEQQGFKIITSNSAYSMSDFDAENIESNLLFDQQAFASVLSEQSDALSEAIYEGNIIAVFDDSNESYQYEKTMNLPLGFEMEKTSKNNTHKSIGYIYQSDESGGIHITRVNVHKDIDSEEEKKYTFAEVLSNYETKSAASMVLTQARSEMNAEFIGTIADYYEGEDEKGDVSVMYEVSTAQDIDKYDYYVVHAYIDATPGRALYYSKYDADILTTSLSTSTVGATLYKTAPNTMTSAASMGLTGFQNEGIGGFLRFLWERIVPDVKIAKKLKSSERCEWKVNINDRSEAAEATISFEPGGTFRIAKDKEKIYISGSTTFTVDAWDESPSIAVMGSTLFYCASDTVGEVGE